MDKIESRNKISVQLALECRRIRMESSKRYKGLRMGWEKTSVSLDKCGGRI